MSEKLLQANLAKIEEAKQKFGEHADLFVLFGEYTTEQDALCEVELVEAKHSRMNFNDLRFFTDLDPEGLAGFYKILYIDKFVPGMQKFYATNQNGAQTYWQNFMEAYVDAQNKEGEVDILEIYLKKLLTFNNGKLI